MKNHNILPSGFDSWIQFCYFAEKSGLFEDPQFSIEINDGIERTFTREYCKEKAFDELLKLKPEYNEAASFLMAVEAQIPAHVLPTETFNSIKRFLLEASEK